MSGNLWLLVEWVDERNVFTSYGVVNSNSLVNEDNDLHPGKMTFVRSKHGNSAKRAQILRVSDDKRLVKEHKILLERQDHQVKNMLTMCMQTIKEMKTDPLLYGSVNANTSQSIKHEASGSGVGAGGVGYRTANDDDSDSASEEEITNSTQNLKISQPPVRTPAQLKHMTEHFSSANNPATPHSTLAPKQKTIITSTPMVAEFGQARETPKLTFDQATQTDNTLEVPAEKVKKIEDILGNLYNQFMNLVSGLQIENVPVEYINGDEEQNITPEHVNEIVLEQIPNNHVVNTVDTPQFNDSNAEVQIPHSSAKSLHVRRVSAHTTNDVEQSFPGNKPLDKNLMVPIGSGRAMVPARVLYDINWASYSAATRQLLQAIFPRKVLATSSLTGKPSPAFANVPAKQCLDPDIVNDIVNHVAQRCNVPKRSVRTCITIKCTDEAKLYRSRMKGRREGILAKQENRENLPPSPASNQSHE